MGLPAEVVEYILRLALTNPTPLDACRMASVSSTFRLAADSDTVWRRIIPPDYKYLMRMAYDWSSISYTSVKELYFRLCDGFLMDYETRRFWLDRRSGKKCYMIFAWGIFRFWQDFPVSVGSRLPLAVELVEVDCLQLSEDQMCLETLSLDTRYSVFLVFKSEVGAEAGVIGGKYHSCVKFFPYKRGVMMSGDGRATYDGDPLETVRREGEWEAAMPRKDGWMELELAEFYIGQDEDKGEGPLEQPEFYNGQDEEPQIGPTLQEEFYDSQDGEPQIGPMLLQEFHDSQDEEPLIGKMQLEEFHDSQDEEEPQIGPMQLEGFCYSKFEAIGQTGHEMPYDSQDEEEFYNSQDDESESGLEEFYDSEGKATRTVEVSFSLSELKVKIRLAILGIEIRPKED